VVVRIGGRAATTLGACGVAYFATRVGQLALSPVLPAVTASLDATTATVGVALSAMWAGYALTQLPSGLLAARVGPRATVLVALAVVAAAGVGVAAAPATLAFVVAVTALGGGAGLYYNAAASLLASEFDALGSALGLHKLGSRGAGLVAPPLAAAVLAVGGWRLVPLAAGALAVAAAALVAVAVPRTPPTGATARPSPRSLVATLSPPRVRRTTLLTAAGEFVEQAAFSFLPTALVVAYGYSVGDAGALFAVHFGAAAVTGPAMGWLADRVSTRVGALVPALAGAAGFGLLAAGGNPLLAVVFTGTSAAWTAPLQSRVLADLPDEEQDWGFGAYRTAYLLVGSLGSAATGALAAVAGWSVALASLGALLVLVALALLAEG
jgi:predicted MFS family arabinose efflux permease